MRDKAKKGIWVLIVLTLFIAGFLFINSDDEGVKKGALIYVGFVLSSILLFWLAREFNIIKRV